MKWFRDNRVGLDSAVELVEMLEKNGFVLPSEVSEDEDELRLFEIVSGSCGIHLAEPGDLDEDVV
jgi:hypothetical protein